MKLSWDIRLYMGRYVCLTSKRSSRPDLDLSMHAQSWTLPRGRPTRLACFGLVRCGLVPFGPCGVRSIEGCSWKYADSSPQATWYKNPNAIENLYNTKNDFTVHGTFLSFCNVWRKKSQALRRRIIWRRWSLGRSRSAQHSGNAKTD